MRRFVLGWKMLGLEQSLGSRIVTYADDLVILCKKGKAAGHHSPVAICLRLGFGSGSVPIISESAFASIALSARAKPLLTCCASPQNTMKEFVQAGAIDRALERPNPVVCASRRTTLRLPLADLLNFRSSTLLSSIVKHPRLGI
jgi:hypothetical protein